MELDIYIDKLCNILTFSSLLKITKLVFKIRHLEILVEYFSMKFKNVTQILKIILEIESLKNSPVKMTIKEKNLFLEILDSLRSQVDNILQKYRAAFKYIPMDGTLVNIFKNLKTT